MPDLWHETPCPPARCKGDIGEGAPDLLCASATHSIGRAGFQIVCPCPGRSSAKMASEVHIMEEPTNGIRNIFTNLVGF